MVVKYLCASCCKILHVESNGIGTNEVGRKFCEACGDNDDRCMHVLDEDKYHSIIDRARKVGWIGPGSGG